MRALLSVVLCLFMAVYVIADDISLGERQSGDSLFYNRQIRKPTIANNVLTAVVTVKAPKGQVINYLDAVNVGDGNTSLQIIRGNIGDKVILILAIGQLGYPLNINVAAYCKSAKN